MAKKYEEIMNKLRGEYGWWSAVQLYNLPIISSYFFYLSAVD